MACSPLSPVESAPSEMKAMMTLSGMCLALVAESSWWIFSNAGAIRVLLCSGRGRASTEVAWTTSVEKAIMWFFTWGYVLLAMMLLTLSRTALVKALIEPDSSRIRTSQKLLVSLGSLVLAMGMLGRLDGAGEDSMRFGAGWARSMCLATLFMV